MEARDPKPVMDAIYGRRSVRSYLPLELDEPAVRVLLEAAVQAPSAMNAQPWGFVVIQNVERLRRYSEHAKALLLSPSTTHPTEPKTERYARMLADPSFNIFYDAGTLIVICGPREDPYAEADCWLAAQNLQLAAGQLGLGTCCIGFALPLLREAGLQPELGIPPHLVARAALIAGLPRAEPPPVPRAAPRILSWLR